MKLLDTYLEVTQEIYDYFGYQENWEVLPIQDSREYFWRISDMELQYGNTALDIIEETENSYAEDIIDKIYEGDEYTLIGVSTSSGQSYLRIFDNEKQIEQD